MNEREEIEMLRCKLKDMNCRLLEQQTRMDSLQKENAELADKLSNREAALANLGGVVDRLKGQVEAYRYCIGCLRKRS